MHGWKPEDNLRCHTSRGYTLVLLLLLYVYDYVFPTYMSVCAAAYRGQKKASDPLELELQFIVSCHVAVGKLNLCLLEDQPVLLIDEPSLQPSILFFETRSLTGTRGLLIGRLASVRQESAGLHFPLGLRVFATMPNMGPKCCSRARVQGHEKSYNWRRQLCDWSLLWRHDKSGMRPKFLPAGFPQ